MILTAKTLKRVVEKLQESHGESKHGYLVFAHSDCESAIKKLLWIGKPFLRTGKSMRARRRHISRIQRL